MVVALEELVCDHAEPLVLDRLGSVVSLGILLLLVIILFLLLSDGNDPSARPQTAGI